MAAVTMSPPQESSMVMAIPRETQRSRACFSFGEAAEFGDLDVDDVHREVLVAAEDGGHGVDDFVEDEGAVGVPADGEAVLVREAGLLDVDVDVADGVGRRAWLRV